MKRTNGNPSRVYVIGFYVLLFGVWQSLYSFDAVPDYLLPSPLQVARRFWRDHEHVHFFRRKDLFEVDREAVSKSQVVAGKQIVRNFLLIDFWRELIGDQHHHHVPVERSFGRVLNHKPGGLGFLARRALRPETDDHITARVFQVICVGIPLSSVADHGDLLVLEKPRIGVLVVINVHDSSYTVTSASSSS
jgi:hypothetical protein